MEKSGAKDTGGTEPSITLVNVNFPTRIMGSVYFYVPVGVLSLAAYVEGEGFSCQVLDYQHDRAEDKYSPAAMKAFLAKARSRVVGISVMAKDLPLVLAGARLLKEEDPSCIVVLGGPGATGSPRGIMEEFPFVDYVVPGEGEIALLGLLKALRDGGSLEGIPGLAFRGGGKVEVSPMGPRIASLDGLPRPAYHLVKPGQYNYIYLPGARGCGHFCSFCDQPALWQGMEVKRSIDSLMGEIDYIKKELKADWGIAFSDNEFCNDQERFEAFIGEMGRRGYHFPFSMDRRIDAVSSQSLKKARDAGCHSVLYGIESGSGRVLKEIRKEFTPDRIIPGLLLSARHVESSVASFIFSFPFESLEDFLKTASVIYSLYNRKTENYVVIQLHYLAPLPRTPIFARYKHQLIRRNVSNLMTSRDNWETYEVITSEARKKALVLPKFQDAPIDEDPAVKEMVEKNPGLFPSHYIYSSPHLELKEEVIEVIKLAAARSLQNLFFIRGDRGVFVGRNFITIAGDEDDPAAPATFRKLTRQDVEGGGGPGFTPGRHYLLSFDPGGFPRDASTGEAILAYLTRLRDEGVKFTLLCHIPGEYLSYTTGLRFTDTFEMPRQPHEAGDILLVDGLNRVMTIDGRKGRHVLSYSSKKAMHQSFFP